MAGLTKSGAVIAGEASESDDDDKAISTADTVREGRVS
jgi:hypothetical protein